MQGIPPTAADDEGSGDSQANTEDPASINFSDSHHTTSIPLTQQQVTTPVTNFGIGGSAARTFASAATGTPATSEFSPIRPRAFYPPTSV
jgi:hypothetical protein